MRALLIVLLALVPSVVMAQTRNPNATDSGGSCFPVPRVSKVDVDLFTGTIARGRLLCLGLDNVVVSTRSGVQTFPMPDVRRIVSPADPTWDGAAKGAAVGLLVLAFCAPHCSGEFVLRTTLGYAAYGMAIDAIKSHREAIYSAGGGASPRIAFRVRW